MTNVLVIRLYVLEANLNSSQNMLTYGILVSSAGEPHKLIKKKIKITDFAGC